MSYFNLEFNTHAPNSKTPASLRHTLNRRYRDAQRYEVKAPDAPGTLIVWARSAEERDEHLTNALFDLIFHRASTAAFLVNPPCIECGGKTRSDGRNARGKRRFRCADPDCWRLFVQDRAGKGGRHHPASAKKPQFLRLLMEGVLVHVARQRLGINSRTAREWTVALQARKSQDLKCPCGKTLLHVGACRFRRKYSTRGKGGKAEECGRRANA